jgi:hypothetical protein
MLRRDMQSGLAGVLHLAAVSRVADWYVLCARVGVVCIIHADVLNRAVNATQHNV